MAEAIAFLRGLFRPASESHLSIHDPGFSRGAAIVDNCRTWNRKLFRWREHLTRFRRDCESCFIALSYSDEEITRIADRILQENLPHAADDLHLISVATPATFGMWTNPIDRDRIGEFHNRGATLKIVGYQPVAADALLPPRVKHRSRLHWHIAKHLAGGARPLLLDRPGGTVTETDIACVLAVIGGKLTTPPRSLILDSISLRVTLDLAAHLGIPCAERPITETELNSATEALLTGTGFGLAGVSRIDETPLPWPGSVTAQLIEAWSNEVGADIRS